MKVDSDIEIKLTREYDRFKRIKGNRMVSAGHTKTLTELLETKPEILSYNPILVNEKFEVIDGQHRLEAAIAAEVPVYYILKAGLKLVDVQDLNSGAKPWAPMDYAMSYKELGNLDYQLYIEFAEEYGYNHDILRTVLSQGQCNGSQFKKGKFQVTAVVEAEAFFTKLAEFAPFYKKYKSRDFAYAFWRLFNNPDYHHSLMLSQLSKSATSDQGDVTGYLREMEGIYNKGITVSEKVRFY